MDEDAELQAAIAMSLGAGDGQPSELCWREASCGDVPARPATAAAPLPARVHDARGFVRLSPGTTLAA